MSPSIACAGGLGSKHPRGSLLTKVSANTPGGRQMLSVEKFRELSVERGYPRGSSPERGRGFAAPIAGTYSKSVRDTRA